MLALSGLELEVGGTVESLVKKEERELTFPEHRDSSYEHTLVVRCRRRLE